ncbi:BTB and MATH domain-containing protein 36-like isoform X1 [Montipora capricornis]|uniref:BTB and MATH domain-containing protein 36-like isoform X1 n=1 Tax=Montipora capricornis TaxID=246305 RepID=UPI0035F16FE7
MAATNYPPHFSEPWKLSDVVLVVEDQRFHVHRSTLAFWSPVFERMFTTDFKEKDIDEISLPGKKASQFDEMLQMMYPSLEEKLITQRNCYFLFELAREYQIDSISHKSVNLMVSMVKDRTEKDVLGMLVYAQTYQIEPLVSTCIYEARRLSLKELKQHEKRDQIEPDNYLRIAEGIIERLEKQNEDLNATCQGMKRSSTRRRCKEHLYVKTAIYCAHAAEVIFNC